MKILKSKYDVNDFLFYKGRSTGVIVAVYNSKVIKDIAREASSNEAFFNLMIRRLS